MSMIFHSAMTVLILMIFLIFTYIWWKKHYTKQCLDLLKKSLLEHIMCLDNRSFRTDNRTIEPLILKDL